MVDTRSTKKQNIWKTKKTHQTIYSCESACLFLLRPLSFSWNPCAAHSYAVAIKYARWQIQARGMLGTQASSSCSSFLCYNTLHTLLPSSSSERTCGGWAVSHWTHLWRCSLFKLNSRNLARARCRTWFLPQALPALWAAHRSKRGINHLHKTHRYDKAWWNLIAPNTNLTILPTKYT